MSEWDQRGLVDDVLARGIDDWIDLGLVIDIARRAAPSSEEARTLLAIGIVSTVLIEGLMLAGTVSEGSFLPWKSSPSDAAMQIVREWRDVGNRPLRPGEIAWLCNTDAGDLVGHAVLEREQG